ncbi:hypothetical protein WMF45_23185 [Sorangium sp. So ce448]|uniref:hypothetical protein n=1 Tax=Sorangium sp. So ce448 TaxID=3133314 RepID=UPI003F5F574F
MPETLELVWIDPKSAARIRKRPPWQRLVDDAQRDPRATEPGEPELPSQTVPPEDRRDVFLILARATATDSSGVTAALSEAVREDGKFAPPLVFVTGELRFPFDELEMLKAAVTTATPFTGGDESLETALSSANDFLSTPGLLTAPAVVDGLTDRIRQAFGRVRRAVPSGYLDAQIERALLEHRRYQKRLFDGAPHLRALLHGPGDKAPMLVYFPADVATKLPLYQRFPARLIAAAHLSMDQFEPHPFALQALALARQIPRATPHR